MNKELELIKRGPGRPEGSTSKRNQEIYHLAEQEGVSIPLIKIRLAGLKLKDLGYTDEQIKALSTQELIDIQSRNANDLLPYFLGKRKPIDSDGDDSSSVISDIMDFIDASKR